MFRALIIGCGKIAGLYDKGGKNSILSHAAAYRKNGRIKVAAYIDIDPARAKKLAAKYGSDSFGTSIERAVIDWRPDVVSVCTPNETHGRVMRAILESNFVPKVIFVEKPVCVDAKELAQIKGLSRRRNIRIIVNHTRRFDYTHRKMKEMIREDKFGTLVRGDIFYYGGWRHNGVHAVDTLLFLFGGPLRVKEVRGAVRARRHDPTLEVVLSLGRKMAPVYLHPVNEKYYQVYDLDLKFDKSRLRIENFGARYVYAKRSVNHMNENVLVDHKIAIPMTAASPLQNAMDTIVTFLKTGDSSAITDYCIDNAAETMKVIWDAEKIYEDRLKK